MTADVQENNRYRTPVAKWLSRIFHPFVMGIVALFLATYLDTGSLEKAALWAGVCLVALLGPLSIFAVLMIRAGRYSDLDVSVREQRHSFYLVEVVGLVLLIVIYTVGGAPRISQVCLYAGMLGIAIGAIINRFTKISGHAMLSAGSTTVLFHLSPPIGLGLAVATGLVSWSRVHLAHHTWRQVIAGWTVGAVSAVAAFYFFL